MLNISRSSWGAKFEIRQLCIKNLMLCGSLGFVSLVRWPGSIGRRCQLSSCLGYTGFSMVVWLSPCRLSGVIAWFQGVTKRCRLSWLTNSALVVTSALYRTYMSPNAGGGGGVVGSPPMSTAVHWSPNKLWRSNSICNL
jgi:hypothetical protein